MRTEFEYCIVPSFSPTTTYQHEHDAAKETQGSINVGIVFIMTGILKGGTRFGKNLDKTNMVMTPALNPSAAAKVLRDAKRTKAGTTTTAAPKPVEAPAPMTSPKATPRFSLSVRPILLQQTVVSSLLRQKQRLADWVEKRTIS